MILRRYLRGLGYTVLKAQETSGSITIFRNISVEENRVAFEAIYPISDRRNTIKPRQFSKYIDKVDDTYELSIGDDPVMNIIRLRQVINV